MKKFLLFPLLLVAFLVQGQDEEKSAYSFDIVTSCDATDVKSQDITGTCWSFSTVSFIESELIRMGKGNHDISEMYNVRMTYEEKAENYLRRQGSARFSQGSLSHDVMNSIEEYGMMPESAYSGRENPDVKYDHREMVKMLKAVLDVSLETDVLSDEWDEVFAAVLDVYMGEVPEKFEYKGEEYTAETFADEMEINPDDYVSITSWTHHPFYDEFILEIPDNFSNGSFYNLPLDEMMEVINHSLDNGYTVAWDADVSEPGFSSKYGMAILPANKVETEDALFTKVTEEKSVNQKNRQEAFDSQQTTDDHLMHITGVAKDQAGSKYYVVKNSWGKERGIDGYIYASIPYTRMKTIAIMVHKDALPKGIKKKLGL